MAFSMEVNRATMLYGGLIVLYLGLNSALNLSIKLSMARYGFRFPLTMTVSHMGWSAVFLLPIMLTKSNRAKHKETLQKQWAGILGIGLFMACNIALNNSSLVDMTLTLNQIIRSSIPVFTCLMAVFIEAKRPSTGEAGSLCLLTAGVMLSVWEGQVAGTSSAILLCIIGTLSNAAMMSMTGRLLSEKIDVLRLTFYTAPVSCLLLLPVFLTREAGSFAQYRATHWAESVGVIAVTSTIALSYNLVHSLMIQRTSAVATTVLGEVKIVGLMLASYLILGEGKVFTLRLSLGCLMALTGFCMYSNFKLWQSQSRSGTGSPLPKPQAEETLPLTSRKSHNLDENGSWMHVQTAASRQ